MNRFAGSSRSIRGSNDQRSRPVSASNAMSRQKDVVRYMTPFTTSGVDSNALAVTHLDRSLTSPVWNTQAGRRRVTLARLIWRSFEYFIPPGSPPYDGHS